MQLTIMGAIIKIVLSYSKAAFNIIKIIPSNIIIIKLIIYKNLKLKLAKKLKT